jgi:hypothetical protein
MRGPRTRGADGCEHVGVVDEVIVFARQTGYGWSVEWPRCLEVYLETLNSGGDCSGWVSLW